MRPDVADATGAARLDTTAAARDVLTRARNHHTRPAASQSNPTDQSRTESPALTSDRYLDAVKRRWGAATFPIAVCLVLGLSGCGSSADGQGAAGNTPAVSVAADQTTPSPTTAAGRALALAADGCRVWRSAGEFRQSDLTTNDLATIGHDWDAAAGLDARYEKLAGDYHAFEDANDLFQIVKRDVARIESGAESFKTVHREDGIPAASVSEAVALIYVRAEQGSRRVNAIQAILPICSEAQAASAP